MKNLRLNTAALLLVFAAPLVFQKTAAQAPSQPATVVVTATPADIAFQAIYKADEAWRRAQRGNESPEDEARRLPPAHLERVDAATQAKALVHWESVLA